MNRYSTTLAVAVVSFVLGGLLSHSAVDARAAAPAGHGRCVGVSGSPGASGSTVLYRAFEDGYVEVKIDGVNGKYMPWEKVGN